jgi:hypothetical protein
VALGSAAIALFSAEYQNMPQIAMMQGADAKFTAIPYHLGSLTSFPQALRHLQAPKVPECVAVNFDALFSIAAKSPIVIAYETVKKQIVQLLCESLGTEWQLLCPFNMGPDSSSARPALVIFVKPSTTINWYQIRSQIIRRLSSHISPYHGDVEFMA